MFALLKQTYNIIYSWVTKSVIIFTHSLGLAEKADASPSRIKMTTHFPTKYMSLKAEN